MLRALRSRVIATLLFSCASGWLALALAAGDEVGRLPAISDALRAAMLSNDWVGARSELARLEKESPQFADFWAYVDALALAANGAREEARARLEACLAAHPTSPWVHKVRFQTAELARSLGDDRGAEQILEEEVARLRAGDRQRELARIYLDFADALSTPMDQVGAEPRVLDFGRAERMYAAVLDLQAPRDLVDWTLWRIGWCHEQLGALDVARSGYEAYLARFDPTRPEDLGAREGAGAQVFEARAGRARVLLAMGRAREARAAYEDLAPAYELALAGQGGWGSAFAGLDPARRDAARRLYEGSFLSLASTWTRGDALQGPLAIRALERFLAKFPSHPRAAEAAYAVGEQNLALARSGDARRAFHALRELPAATTEQPRVLEEDAALRRRAIYQEAVIAAEQGESEAARAFYEEYVRRFPTGAEWGAAQQGILDVEYALGERARARGAWAEARQLWTSFLDAHPLDGRARAIALAQGELWLMEAQDGEEQAREAGRLADELPAIHALQREALAALARVVSKYPGSDEASSALYRTGLTLETGLDQLEDAIAAYRRCNFGQDQWKANARLEQLTKPALAVITERSVGSNEPARVRVQVRNIEKLEVELFALDLEAYFRKHLTHLHVEALDLDLITADRRLEVPIERYRPYAPLEQVVDLPVEGAGVWAVTVSTEKEQATTLVLRSDLQLVVESTRREALVFVQDVQRSQPAAGARVMLVALPVGGASQAPTIHELITGDDGVARLELAELATAEGLRVLALRDGHFASQGLGLGQMGLGAELAPREYLYTDRAAYQPGQRVHWRAILRSVVAGAFAFEEGQSWRIELSDPAGRGVHEERGALSSFGTLCGTFDLPAEAASGTWSMTLEDKNARRITHAFLVEPYRLQRAELVLTPDRQVYYRGEPIELDVSARWYWGEPIADARVGYALPDGLQGELFTDAEGRGRIRFDSRELLEQGTYSFSATLMEEGVGGEAAVHLATRGYQAELALARDVVLAGETFTIRLATQAPDGKPVAADMRLAILRRESTRGGGWAEVAVAEHTLTTDARAGQARWTGAIETGGSYILRAQGDDRFGNPIVASVALTVSGAEDALALRWLIDDTDVDVGEKLALALNNRAGAGLALLTFHAERVLGYRILELGEGLNTIELAVEHAHYPAFAATIAAVRGTRFHHSSAAFAVERRLALEIHPAEATVAPGGRTKVELVVRDQTGAPVVAELSLAVVDEALYELFPDGAPPLEAFFAAARARSTDIGLASSCDFRYEGKSRAIDAELLAELGRQAARLEWESASVDEDLDERAYLAFAAELAPQEPSSDGSKIQAGEGADDFRLRLGVDKESDARRGNLSAPGSPLEKRKNAGAPSSHSLPSDTAFFAPAIVTDERGHASVEFSMPEKSSRWRLTCRGVSKETLLGEARAELITRADFQVVLETPALLTEGDAPRLVARVHKQAGLTGSASLRLRIRGGEKELSIPGTLELGTGSAAEYVFPAFEVGPAQALELELVVEARLGTAVVGAKVEERVRVRPWGLEESVAKSGLLTSEEAFELVLPEGVSWRGRELEIALGPSVDRMLIDEALAGLSSSERWCVLPLETVADVAATIEGQLTLAAALEQGGQGQLPEVAELRARASALVARLITSQDQSGGWRISAQEQRPFLPASATAARALAIARAHGITVPPPVLESAANYLRASFGSGGPLADEGRAMAAAALAASDQASFDQVSRLHRDRASLSDAALAYLAFALVDMQRAPMAREVAAVLEDRAKSAGAAALWDSQRNTSWNKSSLETTALVVQSLERAAPGSARIAEGVAHLLAARPWFPGRARGMAIAAVARYQGETLPLHERVRVTVVVDGLDERTLELDPRSPTLGYRIRVPDAFRKNLAIALRLEGRGRPSFAALLNGFTSDVEARAQASEPRKGQRSLRQDYLAPPALYRGRALPEGFSVLTHSSQTWKNPLRSIGLGQTSVVTIDVLMPAYDVEQAARADWGVLEIPLPAGTELMEGSLQGEHLSSRAESGRLIVQLGALNGWRRLQFTLVGSLPGQWRTLPPTLWRAFEPALLAVAEPIPIAVRARGETSTETRRPTPDELFELGTRAYSVGERELAYATLTTLWKDYADLLQHQPARETIHILFLESIDRKDARSTARFFELLEERHPELTIPFERVIAVGEAYRLLEDFERAALVFRTIIEETYGKDLKVVGTLESQDELAGALNVLQRLWLEYPDLPVVLETELALADKLFSYAKADMLSASLRRAGIDRAWLAQEAVHRLERFQTLYSHDPLAPDAALALVAAELELEHYDRAARLAGEMAPLYAEPRYQDAFLYSQAVAQWYLGQDEAAVERLKAISVATWTDASGIEHPSVNRDLALYILGQIHHARRDAKGASEYYARIEHLFVDAREALAGLREKVLTLEELTTARPGEPVELVLEHKNIAHVELLIYRVDLMTLTLREKNLSQVTAVNLAGIAPTLQTAVALIPADPLRPSESKIPLELSKPGAYLAICRGGELFASGLVLVSDLELEVRSEPEAARVRVETLNAADGRYLRAVDVRVIGTQNDRFVSGKTDPRGLFVAEGVFGASTVIARAGEDHYAFHRGSEVVAPTELEPSLDSLGQDQNYFDNVLHMNSTNNARRQIRLQQEIQRDRSGVQLKQLD